LATGSKGENTRKNTVKKRLVNVPVLNRFIYRLNVWFQHCTTKTQPGVIFKTDGISTVMALLRHLSPKMYQSADIRNAHYPKGGDTFSEQPTSALSCAPWKPTMKICWS
jgi:hypothetical protein